MKHTENSGNKYQPGTSIFAKDNPKLKLIIDSYRQRIYYCAVYGQPDVKHLAYFERELIDPNLSN